MAVSLPMPFCCSARPISPYKASSIRSHLLSCHQLPTANCFRVPSISKLSFPCKLHLSHSFITLTTKSDRQHLKGTIRAQIRIASQPIISPNDQWGMWTALFSVGAFGIWSEKTKWGSTLSGALTSTLVGLAASNLGIISCESPAYSVVRQYLLPISVPLLLFRADLRRILHSTGMLLLAFLIGSVATTVGTVVAYLLVPMRSLGQDNWKIAAALMSRHIGGAVNYVAVLEALGVSPSVFAAGLAADNVICAVYFTSLFALASRIPAEASKSINDGLLDKESQPSNKLPVLQTATALAISLAICKFSAYLTKVMGIQGGCLPCITAIAVVLATIFPTQLGNLAPTGESMALILMQGQGIGPIFGASTINSDNRSGSGRLVGSRSVYKQYITGSDMLLILGCRQQQLLPVALTSREEVANDRDLVRKFFWCHHLQCRLGESGLQI